MERDVTQSGHISRHPDSLWIGGSQSADQDEVGPLQVEACALDPSWLPESGVLSPRQMAEPGQGFRLVPGTQWAPQILWPRAQALDGGEGWGVWNFLLPQSTALAQAGGSDRDKASAGAISVTGASCSPGGSPAGLIKFLQGRKEGTEGRWRKEENL